MTESDSKTESGFMSEYSLITQCVKIGRTTGPKNMNNSSHS